MRIGVLSPVSHGSGATCLSLLLALRLGQGTERVCLTHTHPTDTSLRDALGVSGTVDRTTTPSMIIRTFQSVTAIPEQEYAQYCSAVTRDVDLFTCTRAGDAVCSSEDARYLARYVAEKFPHKHVVIDADDHSAEAIEEVIKVCDVIAFSIRVSRREIKLLRRKLDEYKQAGILAGKRIALVFNRYHSTIVQQKELSALLGVKPAYIYFMDFSEYIAWASFNCKFQQFWQFIAKGDSRVTKIRGELDRLVAGVRQQKVTSASLVKETQLFGIKRADETEDTQSIACIKGTDTVQKTGVEMQTATQSDVSADKVAGINASETENCLEPSNELPEQTDIPVTEQSAALEGVEALTEPQVTAVEERADTLDEVAEDKPLLSSQQPFTPIKPSSTPIKPSSTPIKPSSTPIKPSSTPIKPPSTPIKPPSTPIKPPSTPIKPPSAPIKPPNAPLSQPFTATKQTAKILSVPMSTDATGSVNPQALRMAKMPIQKVPESLAKMKSKVGVSAQASLSSPYTGQLNNKASTTNGGA